MLYIYGLIQGEDNLDKYCLKRWGETPRFCESFANIADVKIERIYEKPKGEEYYKQFFILYMKHENGTMDTYTIRKKVHEDIRLNRHTLINVSKFG